MLLLNYFLQLIFFILMIGFGYSVEALTCHVCSSDKLAICATLQMIQREDLPFELCPPDVESCFSRIENGITIRGCSPIHKKNSLKADHYKTCETDKCNGEIFPEHRLHCVHCADENCVNQTDTIDVRHPCVIYDDNDKCYSVFSPDGSVAYRGCHSEPEASSGRAFCKQHSQQCVECSTRTCNDEPLKWSERKLSCIKCKSADVNSCEEIDDALVAKECAAIAEGFDNECYIYTQNDGIERGCLYEASVDVQMECEKSHSDICILCNSSGCNRAKTLRKMRSESFNDNNIKLKTPHSRKPSWFPKEKDHQHTEPKNENQLDDVSIEHNANVQPKICYAGEHEPGMSFSKKTCKYPVDNCFIYIDGAKVIKGCKIEYLIENGIEPNFFELLPKSKYEICEQSLCNSHDIKQMKCLACESKLGSDAKCDSGDVTEEMVTECSLEMEPTNCYHYIDNDLGRTNRGCMSDLKDNILKNECEKSDKKCKQCKYALCNGRPKFQTCLSCDAGPSPCNSVTCNLYDDRCYTHVNQFDVRRGCLGEANDSCHNTAIDVVNDCENDESRCKVCSRDDNCNHEPAPEEHCIVCDSKNHPQCIANPMKDFMESKCPLALKGLGCFVSLKGGTHVVRGCMSSLGVEGRNACHEEKEICKSCFGNSCNEKLHFFTCHSCDSAKDPNCAIHPDSIHSVICENSKKCYTQIQNETVRRGCVGDEIVPQIEKCTGPMCEFCSDTTSCNHKPMIAEKCIECHGSESIDCTLKSKQCNLDVTNKRGCYHYIDKATGHMKKGCVNELPSNDDTLSDCKSDSDTCKICHGNNCNSKKSFSKCVQCNYLKDASCATNPLTMKIKICKSYADECFTFIENGNLVRGCRGELTPQSLKKCLDDNGMCEKCDPTEKAGCNDKKIHLKEQCIECDSNEDGENCRTNPKSFEGRICDGLQPSKPQGCFISIDGDHYKRGCISKLSKDDKEKCLNQSDICKSIFGNNSNSKASFHECYKCDSRDEPECSRSSTSKTDTEICQHLDATCTTGIDDHGVTHRRCSKDASEEQKFFKYYKICSTSKCNGGIFPPDRLQCYQCNGIDECNLMPKDSNRSPNAIDESSNSLKPLACNVLSTYDQCYTYIGEDDQMHRGCLTDASDSRLLCELNETICIKCNKSGCNNQPKFREPSFSCIHCNDRLECAYGQDETKLQRCTEKVLFNVKESCYGRKTPDGKSFERGCTEDLNKENTDAPRPDRMARCFESGCNKQNIVLVKCQICSSQIGGDCGSVRGGKNFTATCDGESYPYSKRGCYTYVKNDQVERGCVKNLKERYEECVQDTTSCVICETDNCNIDDRSFGHRINSHILLNIFAISFIFCYYQ